MTKENFKNYGIVLMVLSAIFFVGILSRWQFATWILVDWVAIAVCGYIGYKIYNNK